MHLRPDMLRSAMRTTLPVFALAGPFMAMWPAAAQPAGLDVETTLVLKEIMRQFADRGGSVLYCSHMLDVVETIADRVAILAKGELVALGTMDELRSRGGGGKDQRLEEIFRQLTSASDPKAKARSILG